MPSTLEDSGMSRALPASPSQRFHTHPGKLWLPQCVVLPVPWLGSQGTGWHRLFGTGIATDSLGMLMWGPEKVLEAAPAQPHG